MGGSSFPTTRWSLIISTGADSIPLARNALAELCTSYWHPVYSFIRARTPSPDEAQDLTQEFFLYFIDGHILASANPAIGRFRSYLCGSLKHFLANEADRRNAQKRGGKAAIVAIDPFEAEQHYLRDLQHSETPEKIFDRQWALALLNDTRSQLRDSLAREGRQRLFSALEAFLPGGSEPASYAELATELGMNPGAVRVAIHRLRRQYRDLLRANVSHTLSDGSDIDDEIRFLMNALAS